MFPVLCGLGGGWSKNGSPAGPISGRWSVPHTPPHPSNNVPHIPLLPITSRISSSHHTPPHPSNNVPHIILPEYPSYFLTTISPSISFNLLYLRYN
nr:MAG TPA: hypothetical protein [Caudoviricetes sp.]